MFWETTSRSNRASHGIQPRVLRCRHARRRLDPGVCARSRCYPLRTQQSCAAAPTLTAPPRPHSHWPPPPPALFAVAT